MPRYHFNIHDGIRGRDADGLEFATWQDARSEAVRYAGEVLTEDSKRVALDEDWRMEVTDDVGLVLFSLDFCVLASPAIQAQRDWA